MTHGSKHMNGATLNGRRILVVEDDYLVAWDLTEFLVQSGAHVIGPAPTLERALELVEKEGDNIDAAVLDINLRGERSYPVADRLRELGIGFVFTTGYHEVRPDYAGVPRCEKPVDKYHLLQLIMN